MSFVEVALLDIFTPQNGKSKYTKRYCEKHSGIYKLYSGNTDGEFSHIDTYDFDGEYLTWAKDGLAGYMMLHKNEKFSITGHRSILVMNEERSDIFLPYIKCILEPIFRNIIKGRIGELGKNEYTTLNPDMIKRANINIPIPVKANGEYDLLEQQRLAGQYELIEEKKARIQDAVDEIISSVPSIRYDGMIEVPVNQILDFTIPTNSGLTKAFVRQHPGEIPVYGASQNSTIPSYGYIADNVEGVKYFSDCLTYNKDGTSGKLFYRSGRFSLSEKVVPLEIFDELKDFVDIDYLKYMVEYSASKQDYDFSNKATRIAFQNILIPIPVKEDGNYDLERQREIACKCRQIEELKAELQNKTDIIINTAVIIE